MNLKFSLILATVGRTEELKKFLEHLHMQTYANFELIVVDQNDDDRLVPILKDYKEKFSILHLRSKKGLSRARNVGLRYVSGDIVAFPDDDCWYPPDLLERVANFFEEHPGVDGLTGRSVDENLSPSTTRWDFSKGIINRLNVFKRATSISMFIKIYNHDECFDETLGVGAGTPWGSGEEMDYILRLLEKGQRIYYDPNLFVYHPQVIRQFDALAIQRAFDYSCGMGRLLRKHRYPLWFVLYLCIRPIGGMLLSLLQCNYNRLIYHYNVLAGRVRGWLS